MLISTLANAAVHVHDQDCDSLEAEVRDLVEEMTYLEFELEIVSAQRNNAFDLWLDAVKDGASDGVLQDIWSNLYIPLDIRHIQLNGDLETKRMELQLKIILWMIECPL